MAEVIVAKSDPKRLVAWIAVGVVVLGSLIYAEVASHLTQSNAQRITAIEKEVKCPSCIDLSIYNSSSAASFTMRDYVRIAVEQGRSTSSILDGLESAYGSEILMTPPGGGVDTILWLLPVGLGLGVAAGLVYQRRRQPLAVQGVEQSNAEVDPGRPRQATGSKVRALGASFSGLSLKRRVLLGASVMFLGSGLGLLGYGVFASNSSNNATLNRITMEEDVLQGELLASQGKDIAALQSFSAVLRIDPTQPQALAYQGWLLYQAGRKSASNPLIGQGTSLVVEATALDPSYAVGHLFLGLIDVQQRHQPKSAVQEFNTMFNDNIQSSILAQVKSEVRSAYILAKVPLPQALQ